jgi:dTDP-4-amino-4,6-dideoxygalactose transaminase
MAAYLGVAQVRGVASGTDALRMAARAAGLEPGDEVLIQSNAFMAAVEALIDVGVRPVAVDIRLDDLGPDLDDLAARVTPETRALMVVHLYGFPVDLDPLVAFTPIATHPSGDCSHTARATTAAASAASAPRARSAWVS